jgi:hypothetical protein
MESDITTNNAKVTNATHTGDVTGATTLTIADEAVTNAKMAHVATGTVKGRTAAGTGDVEDLDIDTTLKSALSLTKSDVGLNNVANADTTDASNISSGTLVEARLPAISADNTTISDLEVDNLKAGVLDTDLTTVSTNDDTLASAKAIKAYVDANAGGVDPRDSFAQNSGQHLATEGIRARSNAGISILDDSGIQGITLTDSGNVGIGTFTPSSKFDLIGGSGNTMGLHTTKSNTPNGSYIHAGANADWYIRSGNSSGQVILQDTGGNVGIGLTNALASLQVDGNTSASGTVIFSSKKSGYAYASHIHYGGNMDWYIRSGNSSGKVILQDTGGNVGIGNNDPATKAVIEGVNNEAGGLRFRAKEGTNTTDRLTMYATGGSTFNIKQSDDGVIQFLDHDGNVDLAVNTYTRKVGVGTNQPSERLQVLGNIRAGTTSTIDVNIGQHPIYPSYGGVWINGENHYRFLFQANSHTFINALGDGDILFRNDNSQMARMNQNGDFIIDGNFECDDGINIRGTSPSIHFNDTDSNREFTIHVNSNRAYFLPHLNNQADDFSGGWDQMGGAWSWFDLNDGFFYCPRFVDSNNTSRYLDAGGTSELSHIVLDEHIKIRRNSGFRTGTHNWMRYYGYAYGSHSGGYTTVNGAMDIHVPHGWNSDDLIMRFNIHGGGTKNTYIYGSLNVTGAMSKGSGSFDIAHPDPAKTDTHRLRHYFVETPSAGGNIYKYQIDCNEGDNYIDLPDYFEHLNKDSLVWANPFKHFGRAWGEVIDGGKRAKIVCEQSGTYNILIFGDRKDEIALKEFDEYGVEYKVDKNKKNIGVTSKK